jgi:pimeloyl-ACP methyl ester carboxylesterase
MVARLGEIKAPTLILWGRDDNVFPIAQAQIFIKSISNSRLAAYDHCGHFPMVEAADQSTAELRSFLGF